MSKTPRTDEFFYEKTIKPSTRAWLKYARIIESELTDAKTELRRQHAEIERLRGGPEIKFVAGCAYPDCLDGDGRCHLMFEGKCSGPKEVKP